MKNTEQSKPPGQASSGTGDLTTYRSGAVARMLRMPVTTLRVWERRYALSKPALSPSGQRLYSHEDIRRLTLVKQLTDQGHAIGSVATLDMTQLQQVLATHTHTLGATRNNGRLDEAPITPLRTSRIAVIGISLWNRLHRPQLSRRLGRPIAFVGPFESIGQAAAQLQASNVDVLLVHEPQLQAGLLENIKTAAPSLEGLPKAVLYGYAADAVCDTLASAGVSLLREPQPDAVLVQWLQAMPSSTIGHSPITNSTELETIQPRRWDNATLTEFAGISSTIACECPRHVAELLIQLSHFETYSAECENRSPADAQIHGYLTRVAANARSGFEAALEHVALHEGLMLPSSPGQGGSSELQRLP